MIDYLMSRYGWTWNYTVNQPIGRLTLLYQYALEEEESRYKGNPVNVVIQILLKIFGKE